MSLGCSVNEVLDNIDNKIQNLFKDSDKISDNLYKYKFGPGTKFNTKKDLYNHIKNKSTNLENYIKENLVGLDSSNLINLCTVGNNIEVSYNVPKNFTDALNKVFNEKVNVQNINIEPIDTFTKDLSDAIELAEQSRNKMDIGYTESVEDFNSTNIEDNFNGTFDNFISFTKNLLFQSEKRLNDIRGLKFQYKNNSEVLKDLTREETNIRKLIDGDISIEGDEGLKMQILNLEQSPTLKKLEFYSDKHFLRLDNLLQSDSLYDITEAETIINFYENAGTFNYTDVNPLFDKNQMFNDKGEIIVDENIVESLENLKSKAIAKKLNLEAIKRDKVVEAVNALSNVKSFYDGEIQSFDKLFSVEKGLKDATEVDKFIMDVTNGIFSNNGIIPQTMLTILHNNYDESVVRAKLVEEEVNKLTPKVLRIFENPRLKQALNITGKVRFEDVFRAKDENGLDRDGYISRFSVKFFDNLNFAKREFIRNKNTADSFYATDPKKTERLRQKAYNNYTNWIKKNTNVLDISKLPELQEIYGDKFEFNTDNSYKDQLIDILGNGDKRIGEIAYNEEVNKQKVKIDEFIAESETYLDNFFNREGVESIEDLSAESIYKYKRWEAKNNPINFSNNINSNITVRLKAGVGGIVNDLDSRYNILIPKRNVTEIYNHNLETGSFKTRDIDSGYYDKNFSVIEDEQFPELKEFYNLVLSTNELVYNALDISNKDNFGKNNLLHIDKTITEILANKDMTLFARLSTAAKMVYEKLLSAITEKINIQFRRESVDTITGLPTDRVSSNFFKSTKALVNEEFRPLSIVVKDMFGLKDKKFNTTVETDKLPQAYNKIIEDLLGTKELAEKLISSYGNNVPVFKILNDAIEHKVIGSQSFDLPKIMKFYSYSAMEYQARQQSLPILNIIRNYYKQIKKPVTTSQGKEIINVDDKGDKTSRKSGLRSRANAQMDSWFNRAVLGNYNTKNEFGDTSGIFDPVKNDTKLDSIINDRLNKANKAIFLTSREQDLNKKYEDAILVKQAEFDSFVEKGIKNEESEKVLKELNNLLAKKESLGKKYTLSSFIDGILDFLRLKGLGWNLSSQTTNYLEGQIANTIAAASGKYFKSENIYEANQIMMGSMARNISFGKFSGTRSKKASILMQRFRVLQDTSNELQKASTKSAYSNAIDILAPFELMKRVEYLNQTPLMISMLMDISVNDKNNSNPISLWDALNENGELIEDYNTEENRKDWIDVNGQKFFDFSQTLGKAIVDIHGDYHQLRGNMASEYVSGKAILMFKRWFARQVYNRFGVEQADIETKQNVKGRYRSLTLPTATLTGAMVGFSGAGLIGAGPLGIIIGGAIGLGYGAYTGKTSGVGLLNESAFVLKESFMNLLRLPINSMTGKKIIKEADYSKFSKMKDIDLKNFKSNIMEVSLLLALNAFTLMVKMMLWDDDDEQDSNKRMAHNLLINKLMGLSGQATTYLNLLEMGKMFSPSETSFIKFLEDLRKTAVATQNALQGEDTLMSGPNAGGSKLSDQFAKTFLPSPFKSNLGFGTQMERQFESSVIDSWFNSEEKDAQRSIKMQKAEFKKDNNYEQLSDEQKKEFDSAIRSIFTKSKDETYIDRLNYVNSYFDENPDFDVNVNEYGTEDSYDFEDEQE